jgi:hypothetical protein
MRRLVLLGLALGALVIAAVVAAVLLAGGDDGAESAAGTTAPTTAPPSEPSPAAAGVAALVPATLFKGCTVDAAPSAAATESASCEPPSSPDDRTLPFYPNSWQVSIYRDASRMNAAYQELRRGRDVGNEFGRCNNVAWGGEGEWVHGPQKPGGRRFCYFEGNVAVIVWTHGKLGQASHIDTLGVARAGGSDHAGLFNWWRFWHHRIGKCPATDCIARLS